MSRREYLKAKRVQIGLKCSVCKSPVKVRVESGVCRLECRCEGVGFVKKQKPARWHAARFPGTQAESNRFLRVK